MESFWRFLIGGLVGANLSVDQRDLRIEIHLTFFSGGM